MSLNLFVRAFTSTKEYFTETGVNLASFLSHSIEMQARSGRNFRSPFCRRASNCLLNGSNGTTKFTHEWLPSSTKGGNRPADSVAVISPCRTETAIRIPTSHNAFVPPRVRSFTVGMPRCAVMCNVFFITASGISRLVPLIDAIACDTALYITGVSRARR